jgi:hypothetical protein
MIASGEEAVRLVTKSTNVNRFSPQETTDFEPELDSISPQIESKSPSTTLRFHVA